MTSEKPRKRAESLAVENIKRIADTLRTERNEALALAQIKRQEADTFRKQLRLGGEILKSATSKLDGEDLANAEAWLADIESSLREKN